MILVIYRYSDFEFRSRRHYSKKKTSQVKLGKGTRNSAEAAPKKARQAVSI